MSSYLDKAGLTYFWSKLKSYLSTYFASKSSLTDGSVTKVGTASKGNSTTPVYLDAGVPAAGSEYVPKSGGTFTGNVTMGRATELKFVDTSGGTTSLSAPSLLGAVDRSVWLPIGSGTLALTSQIPTLTDVTDDALSAANTSAATIDGLKLYAYGSIRILFGVIAAVNLTTSQTTVANIATGHRPAAQVGLACAWDSARYNTWGIVGAGGALAIRSNAAYTSGNLRVSAIWVVA